METFERARLDAYFGRIAARFAPGERPASFLITHLLPERPAFVRARGGRDRAACGATQAEVRAPRGAAPDRGGWARLRHADA